MKKVAITGSSGRVGRALYWQLSQNYQVIGMDISPSSSTTTVADILEYENLVKAFEGVDTVFHAAALHAPHVGIASEADFYSINVEATEMICKAAIASGVTQIIFTSTTALYGYANQVVGRCSWIDEQTVPKPKTIYHRTKLEAEGILSNYAGKDLSVSVIRMSRCFPEPADAMAVYRLHRGVDYRDVASAHLLAAQCKDKKTFDIFLVSGTTPFKKSDCEMLFEDPGSVIRARCPQLVTEYENRNWQFPDSIDRVYDSTYAEQVLGWRSQRGPVEALKQFDEGDFEVLPPR